MIRARFKANHDDYRPVSWPVKHPYWCTGYAANGSHSIVVAYADNKDEILKNWPEAEDIESTDETDYTFTDRFPKPGWFQAYLPVNHWLSYTEVKYGYTKRVGRKSRIQIIL